MLTIYKREISHFFGSLIGYIVVAVFLVITGLFNWIFKEYSILEFGYANMDPLFAMAPWVFLFLIPAVTMRMFAEEKRNNTIELLVTKPVTDFSIVLAKFYAGISLVLLALIPTITYFLTIYFLSVPVGNIDTGSILGSYIGLFMLASAFTAIGIFCSSVTDNQIVAFLLSVFICAFFYMAFGSLSLFFGSNALILVIEQLGIDAHYSSMSKGVLDTRDLVYFFSLISLFIILTKTVLESRKW